MNSAPMVLAAIDSYYEPSIRRVGTQWEIRYTNTQRVDYRSWYEPLPRVIDWATEQANQMRDSLRKQLRERMYSDDAYARTIVVGPNMWQRRGLWNW